MAYLEFEIPARSWSSNEREILIAKFSEIGFEGFVEQEDIIQAYINGDSFEENKLNHLIDEMAGLGLKIQYRYHETPDQNWNEEWEKKFEPVTIGNEVLIRATFHDQSSDLPFTLVIEPKMSFGTGHHHTTRLMILEMMKHELEGKRVLDMGCGTGVLGIYAGKKGAARVLGIDHDQWAYENALENVERNDVRNMELVLGNAESIGEEQFDMILANITRNTLVHDLPVYEAHLEAEGCLIVSGILAEDVQYVLNAAYRCGMEHLHTTEESNWISLSFVKQ
jgi:ribosomal protein L11 methyltransferase